MKPRQTGEPDMQDALPPGINVFDDGPVVYRAFKAKAPDYAMYELLSKVTPG